MEFRDIAPQDDERLAYLVRSNLRANGLDLPGTVYFDPEVDHLSDFYLDAPADRYYLVVVGDDGQVEGGVGLARLAWEPNTAEVQKLYLSDACKRQGLGRQLMERIEAKARKMGFDELYLETHSNLRVAIKLYRRLGFVEIERPAEVMHSTMDIFMRKHIGN